MTVPATIDTLAKKAAFHPCACLGMLSGGGDWKERRECK